MTTLNPHSPDNIVSGFPPRLVALLNPITSISSPSRQGMTSQVVFAEAAPGSVVIKHASGKHLAALRREYTVLTALSPLQLPTPEPLLFVDSTTAEQEGWLVMQRLQGISLLETLRAEVSAERRDQLVQSLAAVLAHLHAVPAPPALVGAGEDWLEYMLFEAERNLVSGIGEGSSAQLIRLKQTRPPAVAPVLIHGDLFLDNVLADHLQVTGLIDWAFGANGDYRYDLTLAMHELDPHEREVFIATYGKGARLSPEMIAYFSTLAVFF